MTSWDDYATAPERDDTPSGDELVSVEEADGSSPTNGMQRAALWLALVLFGFTVAFPIVLYGWIFVLAVLSVVFAEALEASGALQSAAFESGYTLAKASTLGIIYASYATTKGHDGDDEGVGKRSLAAIWRRISIATIGIATVAVSLAAMSVGEAPLGPFVTTFVLLLGLICVCFFGSVLVLQYGYKLFRWLGKEASSTPYLAGLVTAGGLVSVLSPLPLDDSGDVTLMQFERANVSAAQSVRDVEISATRNDRDEESESELRDSLAGIASTVDGDRADFAVQVVAVAQRVVASASAQDSSTDFDECIEFLYLDPGGLGQGMATLTRRGFSLALAEDTVQDAIMYTCVNYSLGKIDGPVSELGAPFGAKLRWLANTRRARADRDARNVSCDVEWLRGRDQDPALRIDMQRAWCQLRDEDRQVLRWRSEGLSYEEIAERLGPGVEEEVEEEAVRQRVSRARRALRAEMPGYH